MRYMDFQTVMRPLGVFSLNDVRLIDQDFHRSRLSDWQRKSYIQKIARGWYTFSEIPKDESFLYVMANRVYAPSYISLQSALRFYGLIPEGVYQVTSVSTAKTWEHVTPWTTLIYRHVRSELFFGYDLHHTSNGGWPWRIAVVEKALLDLLYLNAGLNSLDEIQSLRINEDVFRQKVDVRVLKRMLKRFNNRSLNRRVNLLLEVVGHA